MQGQGIRRRRKEIGWKLEMQVASLVEVDVQIYCFYAIWRIFFYVREPSYDLKVKWSFGQEEIGKWKK